MSYHCFKQGYPDPLRGFRTLQRGYPPFEPQRARAEHFHDWIHKANKRIDDTID